MTSNEGYDVTPIVTLILIESKGKRLTATATIVLVELHLQEMLRDEKQGLWRDNPK